MKRILSLVTALVLLLTLLVSCKGGTVAYEDIDFSKVSIEDVSETDKETDYVIITVKNFKKLVSEKFYDGLIFHRVIEGFMIQGGGADSPSKMPDPIKGEFTSNGFENNLKHTRGVISMARSQNYNSASSQFFICHADATFLDGQYAGFGAVVEGIETVDAIAATKTDFRDKPYEEQKIKSAYFVKAE